MNDRADISVIIPYVNDHSKLPRALESVLNQTLEVREILIIDNSNLEKSSQDMVLSKLPKVVWLNTNPMIGAARARNIGVSFAKGVLLAFLDSDDYWHPSKISVQLRKMQSNNAFFICSNYEHVNENVQLIRTNQARISPALVQQRCHLGLGSTLVADRSKLLELGGFNEQLLRFEDWDLAIRIFEAGYNLEITSECLATVDRTPKSYWSKSEIYLDKFSLINRNYLTHSARRRVLSGIFLEKGVIKKRSGKPLSAVYYSVISLGLSPTQILFFKEQFFALIRKLRLRHGRR